MLFSGFKYDSNTKIFKVFQQLTFIYDVFFFGFQFTGSLSDNLGILNFDDRHNEKREEIKDSGTSSRGGHLWAGIKGLGYGVWGGLASIPKQSIEGAKEEGLGVREHK